MFNTIFEEILNFLYNNGKGEITVVYKYFEEMCKYTIFEGKQNRAKTAVISFNHLTKFRADPNMIKLAHVIGCCIEILQASFLVHDDIMDEAETRRNKRCWNLISQDKGFGLISVNDGLHLNTVVHKVLQKYFRSTPYYADIVDSFNDAIYQTCTGQCLDMLTSSSKIDWDNFTQARYESIVQWKTAYYSYYLPVSTAMILAGETDKQLFKMAEKILIKIGEYFQIQDDYLDCYADPIVLGKIGRDIEEGKCSWLVIQALRNASDEQISQLKDNYGKSDKKCVIIVKDIYSQLQLDKLYQKYENDVYHEIVQMVDEMDKGDGKTLPRNMFIELLDQIYKRKK